MIRAVVRNGINRHGPALVGFRYGWAGVLKNEAVELRDGEKERYGGKGVM